MGRINPGTKFPGLAEHVERLNTAAVIATLAANTVSYNDTTAGVGTQYWYWVMSSNAMGASALSVSDSGFRKLPTVQNVQATDCTSVDYSTITWTDSNAGETGYGSWYSTTANSVSATWLANTAADTTTYTHAGTPGTLYYYWVRATTARWQRRVISRRRGRAPEAATVW